MYATVHKFGNETLAWLACAGLAGRGGNGWLGWGRRRLCALRVGGGGGEGEGEWFLREVRCCVEERRGKGVTSDGWDQRGPT